MGGVEPRLDFVRLCSNGGNVRDTFGSTGSDANSAMVIVAARYSRMVTQQQKGGRWYKWGKLMEMRVGWGGGQGGQVDEISKNGNELFFGGVVNV